jgi:hypothetical protein
MIIAGYNIDNPSELLYEDISDCQELTTYRNLKDQRDAFIEKKAKELGATHWAADHASSYTVVHYNVGDEPYVESYGSDYGWEMVREFTPRRTKEHCFVIDFYNSGKVEDLRLPNWDKRERVTNVDEAMEYLASFLAETTGLTDERAKEAEEFAAKWNIPFSGKMHQMYVNTWTDCHPMWDSSSAYC